MPIHIVSTGTGKPGYGAGTQHARADVGYARSVGPEWRSRTPPRGLRTSDAVRRSGLAALAGLLVEASAGFLAARAAGAPREREDAVDPDWLIAPRVGIGRLRFGLLPAEVAEASATYGTPTPLLRGAAAEAKGTIAQLVALGIPAAEVEVLHRVLRSQVNLDR